MGQCDTTCTPIVLVPYRDRQEHLSVFAPAIKRYLPQAKIFIIEQDNENPFNRGKLLNVGFLITENEGDYFIMHDVDMIPVEGMVDYSYPERPMHIATQCSQFDYKIPFPTYFGGVNIFTSDQFRIVNGFINTLKGWGSEDCILYNSYIQIGVEISRRECRFESLPHERPINWNHYQFNLKQYNSPRNFENGLTSCPYKITSREEKEGYTHIKVKI